MPVNTGLFLPVFFSCNDSFFIPQALWHPQHITTIPMAPPAAPTAVLPDTPASHFGSSLSSCVRVTVSVLLAGMEVPHAGQLWGSVCVAQPPWPRTVTVGHSATCPFTVWTRVTLNYSNFSSLKSPRCFLEAVGTSMPYESHFYLDLGTWDEDLLPKALCKSRFLRKQQRKRVFKWQDSTGTNSASR